MLTNYPWNGNVRELANFIERAVIITQGQQLEVATHNARKLYLCANCTQIENITYLEPASLQNLSCGRSR
jgi:DNA-binding NtrC family response regulator